MKRIPLAVTSPNILFRTNGHVSPVEVDDNYLELILQDNALEIFFRAEEALLVKFAGEEGEFYIAENETTVLQCGQHKHIQVKRAEDTDIINVYFGVHLS